MHIQQISFFQNKHMINYADYTLLLLLLLSLGLVQEKFPLVISLWLSNVLNFWTIAMSFKKYLNTNLNLGYN